MKNSLFQGPTQEEIREKIRNTDFKDKKDKAQKVINELIKKNEPELLKTVLRNNAVWEDDHFFLALFKRRYEIMDIFIEETDGEILNPEVWDWHPIHEAVKKGDKKLLEFLISNSKEEFLKDEMDDYIDFAKDASECLLGYNSEVLPYLKQIKKEIS